MQWDSLNWKCCGLEVLHITVAPAALAHGELQFANVFTENEATEKVNKKAGL